MDSVIENINLCKYFTIITSHPAAVSDYITTQLHRGATMMAAEGAYTHDKRTVIITVVRRGQAVRLQKFVKQLDKTAFVLITDTSQIIGKGFRGV